MDSNSFRQKFEATTAEVGRVVLGQDEVIEHVMLALLTGGHILIEGVPGLGKTLLVRAFSQVLGASFRRIQFTPDLMPSDVTGGNVFSQKSSQFEFIPGPVFTQLLLADEINRAPAKTQSSLLEAMQEVSVTTDGVTRALPQPFLVLATQNPIESQGTYPLPEAQLDRFLLKVNVRYPAIETELSLLEAYMGGFDPGALQLGHVLTPEDLLQMRVFTETVEVRREILDYITRLVAGTRNHKSIAVGASPRASVGLLKTARAHAAKEGRGYVIPDDVKSLAPAILRHRIVLHPDAELEGVTPDDVVSSILVETSVPGGTD